MFSDFEEALLLFMRGREILAYAEESNLTNEKLKELGQQMQAFHETMINSFYEWQCAKIGKYFGEVEKLGDLQDDDKTAILDLLKQFEDKKAELNEVNFSEISSEKLNEFYINIPNQLNDSITTLSLSSYKDIEASYLLTLEGLYFCDSEANSRRKISLKDGSTLQDLIKVAFDKVNRPIHFSEIKDQIEKHVKPDENSPSKLFFKNRMEEALSTINTLKINYSLENFTKVLNETIASDNSLQLFTKLYSARDEILSRNATFENLRFSEEDLFLFEGFLKDEKKTLIEEERLDDFLRTSWNDVYLYRFELKDLLKGAYRGFSFGDLVLNVVTEKTFEKMWDLLNKATALITLSQSFKAKRDLSEKKLGEQENNLPQDLKNKFTELSPFPDWIKRKPVSDQYFKDNPELVLENKNFIQELNIFSFHDWANSVCTQCYQFSLRINMPLDEYIGKLYKLYDGHKNQKVQYEIQRIAYSLQLIKSKADVSNEKQRRREYEDACCKMLMETREKIAAEIKGLKKEQKTFIESVNTYFTITASHKSSDINKIIQFLDLYVLPNPLSKSKKFSWIQEIVKNYKTLSQKDRGEVHEHKPELEKSFLKSAIVFIPPPAVENKINILVKEEKEEVKEMNGLAEYLNKYHVSDESNDDFELPESLASLLGDNEEVSEDCISSEVLNNIDIERYRGLSSNTDSSLEPKPIDLFKSRFDYNAIFDSHSEYVKKEEPSKFKKIVNDLGRKIVRGEAIAFNEISNLGKIFSHRIEGVYNLLDLGLRNGKIEFLSELEKRLPAGTFLDLICDFTENIESSFAYCLQHYPDEALDLLEKHPELRISLLSSDCKNWLHYCSQAIFDKVSDLLKNFEAMLEQRDRFGVTPLQQAIALNQQDLISSFLNKISENSRMQIIVDQRLIASAFEYQNTFAVDILLNMLKTDEEKQIAWEENLKFVLCNSNIDVLERMILSEQAKALSIKKDVFVDVYEFAREKKQGKIVHLLLVGWKKKFDDACTNRDYRQARDIADALADINLNKQKETWLKQIPHDNNVEKELENNKTEKEEIIITATDENLKDGSLPLKSEEELEKKEEGGSLENEKIIITAIDENLKDGSLPSKFEEELEKTEEGNSLENEKIIITATDENLKDGSLPSKFEEELEKKEESSSLENEKIIITATDENLKDESLSSKFEEELEKKEEKKDERKDDEEELEMEEKKENIVKFNFIDHEFDLDQALYESLRKVICKTANNDKALNKAVIRIKEIFANSKSSPQEAWAHVFSEIVQRYPKKLQVMGKIERRLGNDISIDINVIEETINVKRKAVRLQGLLQYTLAPVQLIQKTDAFQNNLLQRALLINKPEVVRAVTEAIGNNFHILLHKNAEGKTALHIAAQQENRELLDALLAGIPDNLLQNRVKELINEPDGSGVSPLETAFRANNIALCLGLLRRMNAADRFFYLQQLATDGKPFIHFFLDGMERLYENSDIDVLKELQDLNLNPDQWNFLLKMRGEDGKISYERMKNYEVRKYLLDMTGEHSSSLTNAVIKRYYHHAGRDRFHLFSSRRFDVLFRGANFQGDELKTVLMTQYELSLKEASLEKPEVYETEVTRIREEEPLYPVLNEGQGLLTKIGGLFGRRTSSQKGFERLVEDYRPRNG